MVDGAFWEEVEQMPELIANCRVCGHSIPEGEEFCDSLCQEEYESYRCVKCGEVHQEGHTVCEYEPCPEWVGKRMCKECWDAIL